MLSNLKLLMQNFKFSTKNIILICVSVLVLLFGVVYIKNNEPILISSVTYDRLLQSNAVTKATLDGDMVYLLYNNKTYGVLKDVIDLKELYKSVPIQISKDYTQIYSIIYLLFAIGAFCVAIWFFGKIQSSKKPQSAAKESETKVDYLAQSPIMPAISSYTFADVAGIDEVKNELGEIVDFLKNPAKYRKFGVSLPKGVLMVGPPGVGKTLIAKAVAGEANVPFFYQSGSSFAEIYVGVGAKRVRELFAKAKAYAPAIIFIDEIDAVGKSRGEGRNDERETTLNQLLTEMDGFDDNSGVIVIAATNKIEMIDMALLRPGRFDRRIFVALPNLSERVEILKIYLKGKKYELDLEKVSRMCVGFSGAGLATLVNEAALNAMREGKESIEFKDFDSVKDKVQIGSKKLVSLSDEERQIQSIYQGAKALLAYWYGVDFEKISLLEDRFIGLDKEIESKTEMSNKIKVLLAGHLALKIYRNDTFTNSYSDLKSATEIAHSMVFGYAMGENIISSQLDVEEILTHSYSEVKEFLSGMEDVLGAISDKIYKFESIDKLGIKEAINSRYEEKDES